ncbi:MAG TPA: DsbA family oxidoreductase [Ktedonobacterales bacterium]|nr:DsbA family oxidoreductase [Ktedonobacterales bacterium]
MHVEIWSDVVCPWCYIGKRRFESALAQFRHRDDVTVTFRSFQLDPTAPRDTDVTVNERLAGKYGVSQAQAAAMNERVSALAAQEGLDYHLENARYANTFDAHRLLHLAAAHDRQQEVKERLLRAYFTEGAAIGDPETLVRLVAEAGIDVDEARAVLDGDAYADDVLADERQARALGITGVPFFVVDEKYGVSGAQPPDLLKDVLERAWSDAHPLIMAGMAGAEGDEAGACDGDVCDVPPSH